MLELIERYEKHGTPPHPYDNIRGPQHHHVATMFPRMRELIEENRIEKCMRWIGFIQGWLWTIGAYSLDELKNHSRSDENAKET